MSQETLIIGGVDFTETYGVYVDASKSYDKPKKNVETISIPGRSGDLVIDHGTFQNMLITYPCFIKGDSSAQRYSNLMNALALMQGYQEIRVSNDPNHYREGVPVIQQTPTVKRLNNDFYFNLSFNCKPQRFKYPETWETLASSTVFETNLPFRPIFLVSGSGTITVARVASGVTVESWTITVASAPSIYIDCEMQECYRLINSKSANEYVTLSPNSYPVLRADPGEEIYVTMSGLSSPQVKWRRWDI